VNVIACIISRCAGVFWIALGRTRNRARAFPYWPSSAFAGDDRDFSSKAIAHSSFSFEQSVSFLYGDAYQMKSMTSKIFERTIASPISISVAFCVLVSLQTVLAQEPPKEALTLQLPAPTLKGTPEDLPKGPNIEPLSDKPRAAFMVPKGVKNVALNKPVTSNVPPFTGELKQVTDGKKEAFDYDAVEFKRGTQWVQIDLGESHALYAIALWHDHRYIQVMHDVVLQLSDDPEFKKNVQTVFNNDLDNSSGLGIGTEREFFETNRGKLIDAKAMKGRYLRCYLKGSTSSALNCWQEVEVYGSPAK
jgi:hypothetical protein